MVNALQSAQFFNANALGTWFKRSKEIDPLNRTVFQAFRLIRNNSAQDARQFSHHLKGVSRDHLIYLRQRIESLSDELYMQKWHREDRRSFQAPCLSLDHRRAFGKLPVESSGKFPHLYEVVHLWSATLFLWVLRLTPCQKPTEKFCHFDVLNDHLPIAYATMTVLTGLSLHTAQLKWRKYQFQRNLGNYLHRCSLILDMVDVALRDLQKLRSKHIHSTPKSRLSRTTN